jgi:hypothetical protein
MGERRPHSHKELGVACPRPWRGAAGANPLREKGSFLEDEDQDEDDCESR